MFYDEFIRRIITAVTKYLVSVQCLVTDHNAIKEIDSNPDFKVNVKSIRKSLNTHKKQY